MGVPHGTSVKQIPQTVLAVLVTNTVSLRADSIARCRGHDDDDSPVHQGHLRVNFSEVRPSHRCKCSEKRKCTSCQICSCPRTRALGGVRGARAPLAAALRRLHTSDGAVAICRHTCSTPPRLPTANRLPYLRKGPCSIHARADMGIDPPRSARMSPFELRESTYKRVRVNTSLSYSRRPVSNGLIRWRPTSLLKKGFLLSFSKPAPPYFPQAGGRSGTRGPSARSACSSLTFGKTRPTFERRRRRSSASPASTTARSDATRGAYMRGAQVHRGNNSRTGPAVCATTATCRSNSVNNH
jgi:hypothetical protein